MIEKRFGCPIDLTLEVLGDRWSAAPATGTEIARNFKGARAKRVDEVLAALAALGQARRMADGRYAL